MEKYGTELLYELVVLNFPLESGESKGGIR